MNKLKLERAKYFFQFLDSMADLELDNAKWLEIEGLDSYTFKDRNGSGCIARLPGNESLVAFNGSNDFYDFVLDAVFLKTPYVVDGVKVGKVHAGFLTAWHILKKETLEALEVVDPNKERIYSCVGHSLGASLALLMTDELISLGYQVEGCYTAGCPRVGNRKMSRWLEGRFDITRLVNGYDIVPAMLPGTYGLHCHAGKGLYLRKGTIQTSWKYRYLLGGYCKSGIKDHMVKAYASALEAALSYARG